MPLPRVGFSTPCVSRGQQREHGRRHDERQPRRDRDHGTKAAIGKIARSRERDCCEADEDAADPERSTALPLRGREEIVPEQHLDARAGFVRFGRLHRAIIANRHRACRRRCEAIALETRRFGS
jgi:hypothetical protein